LSRWITVWSAAGQFVIFDNYTAGRYIYPGAKSAPNPKLRIKSWGKTRSRGSNLGQSSTGELIVPKHGSEKSIGGKIVNRLRGFVEAAENGEDVLQKLTCRTIRLQLEPQKYSPELVKSTRNLLGASQAIFAQFLGVSVSAVQDWEQGHKPPQGSACRLMDEIRRDPEYWLGRLRELSMPVTA
jgi:putative transcriptional regulator